MILVTGGTGMVGSHLLYFLTMENTKVRAIHRKNSDIASVKKVFAHYSSDAATLFNKIEWTEANITDIPALTDAFKNITQVYHCAAIINFDPSKYEILKKANVEGTANIVNLCLAKKVKKICYVSSVATFGVTRNEQLITEKTPWNPDEKNSVYGITKYGAEMEVWRGTQEGLNAIIVNPGVIFGASPTSGGSGALISVGATGIPFYPSGAMGVIDVKDVVKAMLSLMKTNIKNEQFILVAENISYKKFFTILAPLFGKKIPTKKLPKKIMFFLSTVDGVLHTLFGMRRKLPKATVRSMFTTSLYDASKIKNVIGLQFTPIQETLTRVVEENKKRSN
ncbi:NAD-dependent epimerase/dehydratase family protein [Aequorivita sp. Q41]|uniref:NAD-dependent epimerase/dehydratase family protein n=1 Tax=Aequorivita sp. Q41 TaxID=3153300 RepID=UPI003241FC90